MGLGMTISVAPLTTTVMDAVPDSESGLASGVNNAVSRLASLCSQWQFSVWSQFFNHLLDQHFSQLALSPAIRDQVNAARSQLAAAHNPDPIVQRAESFLSGYRTVIWIATGLAVFGGITTCCLIESGTTSSTERV